MPRVWTAAAPALPVVISLLLTTFPVALLGQPQTGTVIIKNPTVGKILWWQARNVLAAGLDFAAKKAAFSQDIATARAKYFQCYPDCPEMTDAESKFSELLWEKDLWFMYVLYTGSTAVATLDQLTGSIDGGITADCRHEFTDWEGEMEVDSGHFALFQGVSAKFDAAKFLRALDLAKSDYQTYQTCRDQEEFRHHARAPYNIMPPPKRPPVETDPARIVVPVQMYPQLMHLTLLEPLVAPARNGESRVRARLENPLYATGDGMPGLVIAIPAGSDIAVQARLTPSDPKGTNSFLYIQTLAALVGPKKSRQQLLSQDVHHALEGWPDPDTVLISANTPISIMLGGARAASIIKKDFPAAAAAVPATAKTDVISKNYGSRPILQGSRVQTILMEPIEAANFGTGKLFHAQLNADMVLPRDMTDVGALKLPRGTEAYLKVVDKSVNTQFGRQAELSVDHIVADGRNIPLHTVPWTTPYSIQPATFPNGRPRPAQVLWANGDTKWFDISEQQDVPDSGPVSSIETGNRSAAPADVLNAGPNAVPNAAPQAPAPPAVQQAPAPVQAPAPRPTPPIRPEPRSVAAPPPAQTPPPPPAPPSAPVQAVSPASLPPTAGPLGELQQRYSAAFTRAGQDKADLAQFEKRLASQGLSLRSDIADARSRLEAQLQTARAAIQSGNAAPAEENLRYAENALSEIEKFLGK